MRVFILSGLLFLSAIASAQELPLLLGAEASGAYTKDGINYRRVGLLGSSELFDIFWPYQNESENITAYGFQANYLKADTDSWEYEFLSFSFAYKKKFSLKQSLEMKLGFDSLSVNDVRRDTHSLPNASLHWKKMFGESDKIRLQLQAKYGYLLNQVPFLSTRPQRAEGFLFEPQIQYLANEKNRLQLRSRSMNLLGGKAISHTDAEWLYGLSHQPWLWLGVGAEYLSHQYKVADYWSPTHFWAYGLRLNFSWPVGEKNELFCGGSLNQIKEEKHTEGQGHYVQAGWQYGSRDNNFIRLFYEGIKSRQSSSKWFSDGVGMNLQWDFR